MSKKIKVEEPTVDQLLGMSPLEVWMVAKGLGLSKVKTPAQYNKWFAAHPSFSDECVKKLLHLGTIEAFNEFLDRVEKHGTDRWLDGSQAHSELD